MKLCKINLPNAAVLALCSMSAFAQAPAAPAPQASAPAAQVHTNNIGFSYTLPADWDAVDTQQAPIITAAEAKVNPNVEVISGLACTQMALTARHGTPASAIVAVMLPFDCYGQTMKASDLASFGQGAVQGFKEAYTVKASATATYVLDGHNFVIGRANGVAKGQENPPPTTVEVACTILSKAAVCWEVVALDDATLQTFENGLVSLEGGASNPLVPPAAAAKLTDLAKGAPK